MPQPPFKGRVHYSQRGQGTKANVIDIKAHDPETGLTYEAESSVEGDSAISTTNNNRENRELMLLGENARLRDKLNRVIDEAEASIGQLMQVRPYLYVY